MAARRSLAWQSAFAAPWGLARPKGLVFFLKKSHVRFINSLKKVLKIKKSVR
jgi:hypothetical protein